VLLVAAAALDDDQPDGGTRDRTLGGQSAAVHALELLLCCVCKGC